MKPDDYVKRLIEITAKKLSILKEIYEITVDQSNTITEEGIENLDGLISKKQEKIDLALKTDEEYEVYFKRFKQVVGVKRLDEIKPGSIGGLDELQKLTGSAIALINSIGALEKKNSDKANNLLNDFGEEIKKINQAKRVESAYRPDPASFKQPSYFIDKKK